MLRCHLHNAKPGQGYSPCRAHLGAESSWVEKRDSGFAFVCPNCRRVQAESSPQPPTNEREERV